MLLHDCWPPAVELTPRLSACQLLMYALTFFTIFRHIRLFKFSFFNWLCVGTSRSSTPSTSALSLTTDRHPNSLLILQCRPCSVSEVARNRFKGTYVLPAAVALNQFYALDSYNTMWLSTDRQRCSKITTFSAT
jgi:hypothetical protein